MVVPGATTAPRAHLDPPTHVSSTGYRAKHMPGWCYTPREPSAAAAAARHKLSWAGAGRRGRFKPRPGACSLLGLQLPLLVPVRAVVEGQRRDTNARHGGGRRRVGGRREVPPCAQACLCLAPTMFGKREIASRSGRRLLWTEPGFRASARLLARLRCAWKPLAANEGYRRRRASADSLRSPRHSA